MKNFCLFVLSILLSFSFFSCANSVPDILNTNAFLVCDFLSETAPKTVRLAVFAETSNNVRRTDSIQVSAPNGLKWLVTAPVIFENNKREWAGYAHLVNPDGIAFASGLYTVLYTDASGKTDETSFYMNFSEEIISASIKDFPGILGNNFLENIAVFSENESLIFYGRKDDRWNDAEKIFSAYQTGNFFRTCYVSQDNSVICVMPAIYKTTSQTQTESETQTQ